MSSNFYNTINQTGDDLKESHAKVRKQTDLILLFFKLHSNKNFTPAEVLAQTKLTCPITSVRRAITDLTNAGLLEKCNHQRMGLYGKPNYAWRAKPSQLQMILKID